MDKTSPYYRQVQLLVRVLPFVAEEHCFALKGGTALNLFIRDLPRLSVDIDLAYLPLEDRDTALKNLAAAFGRIKSALELKMPEVRVHYNPDSEGEHRLIVSHARMRAQIIIEASPVMRGSVFPVEMRSVTKKVEDEFGYAEIQVLSMEDLYAGKITAALDRQHPRDFFDVKLLLENEGLTRGIVKAFLVYVIGHPRPISELLSPPRLKDLKEKYDQEFVQMPVDPVSLEALEAVRSDLISRILPSLTVDDRAFLLSFKSMKPDWGLLGLDNIDTLPAVYRFRTSWTASAVLLR